jgi:uncharacterized protein with HEPN domain
MKNRDPKFFVQDMLEYAQKVEQFVAGMTKETFLADERTVLAVIRCFEVIGESANRIPETLQEKHPEIPWPKMIGFRNYLIHEYLGIKLDRVWVTANREPVLKLLEVLL